MKFPKVSRFLDIFRPQAIGTAAPNVPATANAVEQDGGIFNNAALATYLAAIQKNGAHAFQGFPNFFNVDGASGVTLNSTNLPTGLPGTMIRRSGAAGVSDTLDTASNIIAGMPGAFVGQTFNTLIVNINSGTLTIVTGVGITLAGTTTVVTVAGRMYQGQITNLANPALPNTTSTNTTTTTAAVAANSSQASPTSVIPVTASTGMTANSSFLQWTYTDGTTGYGKITAISTLNITVAAVLTKAIASGAAIAVYNDKITFTGCFAWPATMIA